MIDYDKKWMLYKVFLTRGNHRHRCHTLTPAKTIQTNFKLFPVLRIQSGSIQVMFNYSQTGEGAAVSSEEFHSESWSCRRRQSTFLD